MNLTPLSKTYVYLIKVPFTYTTVILGKARGPTLFRPPVAFTRRNFCSKNFGFGTPKLEQHSYIQSQNLDLT